LIIVDSIAHCIRHEEDSKAKIKFLNSLAENFKRLALHHNIAIVIVNQVSWLPRQNVEIFKTTISQWQSERHYLSDWYYLNY